MLVVDPPEPHTYNDAIELLEGCLNATRLQELLLTVMWSNVTELNQDLSDLVATNFAADTQFLLGADGLLEVQAWIKGVKGQVQTLGVEDKGEAGAKDT